MRPLRSLVVLRDGGGCNKGHRQAVSRQGQRQAFSRQQAAMIAARGVARRLPSKAGAHLAFFKLALIRRMRKLEHIVLRESKAFSSWPVPKFGKCRVISPFAARARSSRALSKSLRGARVRGAVSGRPLNASPRLLRGTHFHMLWHWPKCACVCDSGYPLLA